MKNHCDVERKTPTQKYNTLILLCCYASHERQIIFSMPYGLGHYGETTSMQKALLSGSFAKLHIVKIR